METHDIWMKRALQLAEKGRGLVEPNPMVGAVIVREGQVLGEGWHQRFGGPHAEIHALNAAGTAAQGATLYVTLEPCCHHGKTPPCTDALVRAGIGRVVAAMRDPFHQVAGKGAEILRAAGIPVELGVCEADALRLNAPYLSLVGRGRPYVHAKWAMTLDGKIATRTGHSRWISNEASRQRVHQLRGRMDAIVVGIGTALADDPQLTARPPGPRLPIRVILDSQARLPLTGLLASTAREVPTLVVCGASADPERTEALHNKGCEILVLPDENGRPSVPALLAELGRRRHTNVLVEGGGEVLGSFLVGGVIDEVHVFVAPRLVGGGTARTPIAGLGFESIDQGPALAHWEIEKIEGDLYVHGWR